MRIVIIGAGPTGLGAGYRLAQLGVFRDYHQVLIFDRENCPGGLAASVRDTKGFWWDLGGHVIFSHYTLFDQALDQSLSDWNYHQRAAYALYIDSDKKPRYVPYPIQHNLQYLDSTQQKACLTGLNQIPASADLHSFEDWLQINFGLGLYNLFMGPYNRKIWTVPPSAMSYDWVGERVAIPTYEEAQKAITQAKVQKDILAQTEVDQELISPDNDLITPLLAENDPASIQDSGWGPNRQFRYPQRGGTGAIWQGVARRLPSSWLKLGNEILGVEINNRRLHLKHQSSNHRFTLDYDVLISTAPLNQFLAMVQDGGIQVEIMKAQGQKLLYNAVQN